jgi:hypothetical protein
MRGELGTIDPHIKTRTHGSWLAKRAGFEFVEEFCDADVSGVDPIESRPGFSALLDRIEASASYRGSRRSASRFARQLIAQGAGIMARIGHGVHVLNRSRTA